MTAIGPEAGIGAAFLEHHLRFRPVDATFMGIEGHDDRLPPAGAATIAEERRGLEALRERLKAEPVGPRPERDPGAWLDHRLALASVRHALAEADLRPRLHNPAWYTGEAAFGILALLLPETAGEPDSVRRRIEAVPDFLHDGLERLRGQAVPRAWAARARREAAALQRLLTEGLELHPAWREDWRAPAQAACAALQLFASTLPDLPDCDPACGPAHLEAILANVHGLDLTVAQALRVAEDAFVALTARLEEEAARLDPDRDWREQIAAGPVAEDAPAAYREWHLRAMREASHLMTPALDYELAFRPVAEAFRPAAGDLYFLSYRSPPAHRPGTGSTYWTADGQPLSAVRSTHAVHHGSIGHHTQNARARMAPGVLARVAGTDAALGLSLLASGTMVEGWACHAQDLMLELPGFVPPHEVLLQRAAERRNAASVLVDLRLHAGEWSAAEAERFYVEEAGFPAARAPGEIVRNSMFPGSRAMYWLGTREIRRMRATWDGSDRSFHDALLGCGHVPVRWAEACILAERRNARTDQPEA